LHKVLSYAAREVLDLCFTLLDAAAIMPYYFYLCDVIPGGEHWRLSPAPPGRGRSRGGGTVGVMSPQ